ncbi:hypothetical protein H6P81_002934 [Aristolochia fimbriata]|uniref:Uncharacterized protein n=1 Tax=Aristolochia fimbriata TaxID=158543 RepID=A0AAV7FEC0_ARIFI|nr:hypothetical protein H6P81_002934 [Aristolochia fimbriata]
MPEVFTKLDLRSGILPSPNRSWRRSQDSVCYKVRSHEVFGDAIWLNQRTCNFLYPHAKVFSPFLDKFVVVYLDDIVIYSRDMQEHVQHLQQVFEVLRENSLYVKKEKCSFGLKEVSFLGHWIGGGKLWMDKAKTQAIADWIEPTKVADLRSFLGLVNYYRRFIKSFSAKAAPLTDLLKKKENWCWSPKCQKAFDDLKPAATEEPVLHLADFNKPFQVLTDASDFAIGGVLEQDGHPIAYESRKLNETERRYTVQEREMTAIVHCLRTWRHYLLGSRFVVFTDNVASSYFLTQQKLSPKQARWQDFLAEFDMMLEYKPGRRNNVADALSRRADLTALHVIAPITQVSTTLADRIKEGLRQDPQERQVVEAAALGGTRKFWIDDGLVRTRGGRVYVPARWFCGGSLSCESIMIPHGRGTLDRSEPLHYWSTTSIGQSSTGRPPATIISDRDPRFTGKFWTELFQLLGTTLNFSTSFHPQTDGQTERINAILEEYLRHFVAANQTNWPELLDVAQFSYNLQRSESTGSTPFQLATGRQPTLPVNVIPDKSRKSPSAYRLAKQWKERMELARTYFHKATKRMKKFDDRKRRHLEFQVGDLVLVKMRPEQFRALRTKNKGLNKRYEGPFPIIRRIAISLRPGPFPHCTPRAPIFVSTTLPHKLEYVIAHREARHRGRPPKVEYLIKWRDIPEPEATWHDAAELWQFEKEIAEYREGNATRTFALSLREHDTWRLSANATRTDGPKEVGAQRHCNPRR